MANTITLAKKFVPLLDETYQAESLTAVLDGDNALVAQGANAGELIIPRMTMQGLGDYSRSGGYVEGDVTLTNETVTCNFDRGRMFNVDTMDDMETAGVAFGRLAGEFIRNKVVPELDAFRLSSYASAAGVSTQTGTLEDGAAVIAALRAAVTKLDEDEVPLEERYLFITPTLHGLIQDMDTTKSREVMDRFAAVVDVPQTRFYTAIAQKSGKVISTGSGESASTTDETAGGYGKAAAGKDINFMVIQKAAVIQYEKHVAPKILTPQQNPDADAYKFGYHSVGVAKVQEGKVKGVYVHHKA